MIAKFKILVNAHLEQSATQITYENILFPMLPIGKVCLVNYKIQWPRFVLYERNYNGSIMGEQVFFTDEPLDIAKTLYGIE